MPDDLGVFVLRAAGAAVVLVCIVGHVPLEDVLAGNRLGEQRVVAHLAALQPHVPDGVEEQVLGGFAGGGRRVLRQGALERLSVVGYVLCHDRGQPFLHGLPLPQRQQELRQALLQRQGAQHVAEHKVGEPRHQRYLDGVQVQRLVHDHGLGRDARRALRGDVHHVAGRPRDALGQVADCERLTGSRLLQAPHQPNCVAPKAHLHRGVAVGELDPQHHVGVRRQRALFGFQDDEPPLLGRAHRGAHRPHGSGGIGVGVGPLPRLGHVEQSALHALLSASGEVQAHAPAGVGPQQFDHTDRRGVFEHLGPARHQVAQLHLPRMAHPERPVCGRGEGADGHLPTAVSGKRHVGDEVSKPVLEQRHTPDPRLDGAGLLRADWPVNGRCKDKNHGEDAQGLSAEASHGAAPFYGGLRADEPLPREVRRGCGGRCSRPTGQAPPSRNSATKCTSKSPLT